MNRIRRFTSCSLVAGVAALAACSDAPTSAAPAAREQASTRAVSAANANAGTSGSVVEISTASRSVARLLAPATLNATARDFNSDHTQGAINYQCPSYMPSEGGTATTSAYYNCFEPIDPIYPVEPTDPVGPIDPCASGGCTLVQVAFGSDATPVSILSGTTLKTLRLVSFSQAIANVSFTTLDAAFKNVGAQTSCYNVAGQFDSSHASGFGSPLYLEASRSPAWQGVIRWQVDGTHGFSPVSGATGGGTFWSSDFTCG